MIRSELNHLVGAKMVNLKCRVFGGKTGPFPMVQVFRVVRPIATVQIWVELDPEPNWQFGPVANTAPNTNEKHASCHPCTLHTPEAPCEVCHSTRIFSFASLFPDHSRSRSGAFSFSIQMSSFPLATFNSECRMILQGFAICMIRHTTSC